jgi:protoporphyrinogen oxidase
VKPVVILGAGPAGLAAAWRLARRGFAVDVVERNTAPGGNAGSFDIDGIRVDYGSHRLHPSCRPEILGDIRAMLGGDLLERPRHGRILLGGRWLHFPLKPPDVALHAPPAFLAGTLMDAVKKRAGRGGEENFATVLERGLGRTICREFYFPYARKIWGMDPERLHPEQARRRVSAGSLSKLARKLFGARGAPARGRFYYPRRGFGQISEGYLDAARQAGARVHFSAAVEAVEIDSGRVVAVRAAGRRLASAQVLSTIPLPLLAQLAEPAAPAEAVEAAAALAYRSMILIYLALDVERFTEYDAHYFPGADIPITRLSEPKNYGLAGATGRTVLCAELPCSKQDAVWQASDGDLGALAAGALKSAGLPLGSPAVRVVTRRLAQAYPVYSLDYRRHFDRLDGWVSGIEGLVTLGRQGLFAHDNTHHTLAMGYAAADSLDDEARLDRDAWRAHRRSFEAFVVED